MNELIDDIRIGEGQAVHHPHLTISINGDRQELTRV